MGGKRPYLLAGQRDWLLARLNEKPDLTLHALLTELGARGVTVCCDTLWRFLRREGLSFKKASRPASKSVLTSPAGAPHGNDFRRGSCPSASSSSMRPGPSFDKLRTNMFPRPWMVPARREASRQGSSWPLENPDLRGGVALRRHRCALRL
jgi:hypothetical protein